jgi:2-hydroxy-6-oxonona-2,4-dienedioate hydrolase
VIHPIQSLPEVQRLEALAARTTTPCGPDGRVVWRRWGSGPPVVLLHGGSGAWTHWVKNIDALAASHTLWIPDLPGCGESDLPPGATDADSIYETVATGIAQLANGQPLDLVGFSFGSLISAYIAARHPALIRRLILVAPPALGLRGAPLGLKSLGVAMTEEQREEAVRFNLQRFMLHLPGSIDDMAVALHAGNFEHDRLRRRRIAHTDVMTRLQLRWQCPVHVIVGREDPLAKPELHRRTEVLSRCQLIQTRVIDGAGHWVQYERPEEFHLAINSTLCKE